MRNRQQCVDIDECAYNNGGCKGPCVNTLVSKLHEKEEKGKGRKLKPKFKKIEKLRDHY